MAISNGADRQPDGGADSGETIAIVGMGCRFPGGVSTPAEFWKSLVDGVDAISELPGDRWEHYESGAPENAAAVRKTTRLGGFVDDVDGFDAAFFGISPREAALMDPQQRMALEVSWEALEHAGIVPAALAGTDAGVYIGVNTDDHGRKLLEDLPRIEAWTGIGSSMCAVANRVSYSLDLRGPSMVVDTACSSSLVALHLAAQALRAGEVPVAIAGGVMLMIAPGPDDGDGLRGRARPGRAVQVVRRVRQRLRPRRGLRDRRAQAAVRRAPRRRPGARGDPRQRGRAGRPDRRDHGAQPRRRRSTCCARRAASPGWRPSRWTTSRRTAPAPAPATRSRRAPSPRSTARAARPTGRA